MTFNSRTVDGIICAGAKLLESPSKLVAGGSRLDGEGVDVRLEGAQEGGEVQERRLDKFYHFIISGAPGYHH